jgi:hypothetical protein
VSRFSHQSDAKAGAGRRDERRPSRRPRWVRFTASALGCLHVLTACYTYVPNYDVSTPIQGDRLEFEITDAGRLALTDRLGPGILSVEGRVVAVSADEVSIAVSAVKNISSGRSRWNGEKLSLPRSAIARTNARRLSRVKTAFAFSAAAVGLGLFIATRGLFGSGSDPGESPPGGNGT